MAYFILKDSPIIAVQQTDKDDAPGVENSNDPFPKKLFRKTPEATTVEIFTGDYVVVDKDGNKDLVRQAAFELLFKVI